jgi:hypothetical protein
MLKHRLLKRGLFARILSWLVPAYGVFDKRRRRRKKLRNEGRGFGFWLSSFGRVVGGLGR